MADFSPISGLVPDMGGVDWTKAFSGYSANAAPAAAAAPGAQGLGSWFGGLGLGQMGGSGGSSGLLGLGQLGLSGLGTLGSLYTAFGGLNLAKDQFNFQKQFAEKNLTNQTKSYNTALSDKANARYFTEGKPQSEADSYIAANKL